MSNKRLMYVTYKDFSIFNNKKTNDTIETQ